jgi:hypothetical protein
MGRARPGRARLLPHLICAARCTRETAGRDRVQEELSGDLIMRDRSIVYSRVQAFVVKSKNPSKC